MYFAMNKRFLELRKISSRINRRECTCPVCVDARYEGLASEDCVSQSQVIIKDRRNNVIRRGRQ
jgi:hypothetical protein